MHRATRFVPSAGRIILPAQRIGYDRVPWRGTHGGAAILPARMSISEPTPHGASSVYSRLGLGHLGVKQRVQLTHRLLLAIPAHKMPRSGELLLQPLREG